jgi:hypothetical protein
MDTTPPKTPTTPGEWLLSVGCHIGSAYPLGSADLQLSQQINPTLVDNPDYRPYAEWEAPHPVEITPLP